MLLILKQRSVSRILISGDGQLLAYRRTVRFGPGSNACERDA
jgi:hypothetical protein